MQLAQADSPESIRQIESQAAGAYWAAWRTLPINFPRKDEPRVPAHWRAFGARVSPLTGSPRLAANPPNAILNYLYAVLESESRLAAAALGLDPGMGVLHVDTPARDSLACDLMEVVRPQVDGFLLDWITRETLKREWFFEQRDGNCRLMPSLAIRLSETAPAWGRAVAPIAEWVAQSFWTNSRKPARGDHTLPTRLTQRRRSEGRGHEFILDTTPAPRPDKICPGCGASTLRGRHCPNCGREISREKLIELAKIGRVAAQSPESRKKHSATQRRHEAAKRAWRSSPKPVWPDEATYITDIQPRLATVPISALSSKLGVSESYAADIRAGRYRPHPRHWLTLAGLVGVSSRTSDSWLGCSSVTMHSKTMAARAMCEDRILLCCASTAGRASCGSESVPDQHVEVSGDEQWRTKKLRSFALYLLRQHFRQLHKRLLKRGSVKVVRQLLFVLSHKLHKFYATELRRAVYMISL